MRIAVIGAQGRTGRLFADAAERAGHEVVRVTRAEADATDADGLRPFVADADIVVSCVGPSTQAANGILASSTRALLDAGAARIMTVSATGPYTDGDGLLLARVVKPILARFFFGGAWQDMRDSDALLAASDADWTSMRPPQLTDRPAKGYRYAFGRNVANAIWVTRADLADAMVDALEWPEARRNSVSVAN